MRKEWGEADKNGCVYRGCDGWEEKHSSSPSPPSSSFTPHMILGRGGPNVFFLGGSHSPLAVLALQPPPRSGCKQLHVLLVVQLMA